MPAARFFSSASIPGLRADMYHLLALGFAEPTTELAEGLIQVGFQMDVKAILEGLAISETAVSKIVSSLDRLTKALTGQDPEKLCRELNIDYTHLFIGPGPAAVSPYESIHVDAEPDVPVLLMVGPAASAVLDAYREAGLSIKKGLNEPPDHIATELEFMYYLCVQEVSAGEHGSYNEEAGWQLFQRAFFTEHLGKWGIDFCRTVQEAAETKFYNTLGLLAATFLAFEAEVVKQASIAIC